jgi:dTDP-4-dehydrorhamnose reductase
MLVGADGQLGSDLKKVLSKDDLVPLTISDLDITDEEKVNKLITKTSPDVVVNTAAFNDVDGSETKEATAFAVNALGPKNLAIACNSAGAKLVHISTDYVFDGESDAPYCEEDPANPRSAYGISKLCGELFVKYLMKKYFLIRPSSLFGSAGCMGKGGSNFVESVIKKAKSPDAIKVVSDQIASPTYTFDLAQKISELIRTDYYGLFHVTNKGACSWFGFAKKTFELLGMTVTLQKISLNDWKAPAQRPKYSVLKHQRLIDLGMDDLRSWEDALKAYLIERGHIRGK